VIFPTDNSAGITSLKDLAKPGLSLVLADASVPVGQYTLDFLDNASVDAAFSPDFKDKVLANVVSYEENVKGVVTKVMLGEADAGVVYVSDITKTAASKTGKLEIPDALNTIAAYPIAVIADSQSPDLAAKFVDLVMSELGQSVLAGYGFIPAVQ
jgi:molybdate transport system substrate-binding protein